MAPPTGRAPRTDLTSDGFEASLGGGSHWHGVRWGGTVRTHGPATIRASVSGARVGPVSRPRPPPPPHPGRLRGEFEDWQPLATLSTRRFSPLGERPPEIRPSLDEFRTRGGRAAASARGRHAIAVAEAARHARVEEAACSCASRRSPRAGPIQLDTGPPTYTCSMCYTPPFLQMEGGGVVFTRQWRTTERELIANATNSPVPNTPRIICPWNTNGI